MKIYLKACSSLIALTCLITAYPQTLFGGEIVVDNENPQFQRVTLQRELQVFNLSNFPLTVLPPGEHQLLLYESQQMKTFVNSMAPTKHQQRIESARFGITNRDSLLKDLSKELTDNRSPRALVTPLIIGSGPYSGHLGFVMADDFHRAQVADIIVGGLPPSGKMDDVKLKQMTKHVQGLSDRDVRSQ